MAHRTAETAADDEVFIALGRVFEAERGIPLRIIQIDLRHLGTLVGAALGLGVDRVLFPAQTADQQQAGGDIHIGPQIPGIVFLLEIPDIIRRHEGEFGRVGVPDLEGINHLVGAKPIGDILGVIWVGESGERRARRSGNRPAVIGTVDKAHHIVDRKTRLQLDRDREREVMFIGAAEAFLGVDRRPGAGLKRRARRVAEGVVAQRTDIIERHGSGALPERNRRQITLLETGNGDVGVSRRARQHGLRRGDEPLVGVAVLTIRPGKIRRQRAFGFRGKIMAERAVEMQGCAVLVAIKHTVRDRAGRRGHTARTDIPGSITVAAHRGGRAQGKNRPALGEVQVIPVPLAGNGKLRRLAEEIVQLGGESFAMGQLLLAAHGKCAETGSGIEERGLTHGRNLIPSSGRAGRIIIFLGETVIDVETELRSDAAGIVHIQTGSDDVFLAMAPNAAPLPKTNIGARSRNGSVVRETLGALAVEGALGDEIHETAGGAGGNVRRHRFEQLGGLDVVHGDLLELKTAGIIHRRSAGHRRAVDRHNRERCAQAAQADAAGIVDVVVDGHTRKKLQIFTDVAFADFTELIGRRDHFGLHGNFL